jgi:Fe-S-cluster-containing hydrogenase component 2/CRP-like cAMP-binding protein
MAKQVLMPLAQLESRPTDIKWSEDLYPRISLFAQLKKKLNLDKYPGTLVIRRYKAGNVICRQGEAGWVAIYTLPARDVLAIRESQMEALPPCREKTALEAELIRLRQAEELLRGAPPDHPARKVATMHLAVARPTPGKRGPRPTSITIDGPTEINAGTLQAPLHEGELFGEMSCLYGTPHSTTLIADRDCYVLEMLRNILEQVQKDAAYKAHIDKIYKERTLKLHLRKLSLFHALTDAQYELLREKIDLVSYEAGQIIYDEFDRSDGAYIIRSGLVKVLKKTSTLLAQENIRDWRAFGAELCQGEKEPATPRGKVWRLLSEAAQAAARVASQSRHLPEKERLDILHALNDAVKNRQFPEAAEFQALIKNSPVFLEQGLPEKLKKDASDQDVRRFNRLLLEQVFQGPMRAYKRRVGPDRVLFYCSRGDFIGETGLTGEVRGETCIAHGHPMDATAGRDAGRVEVVRIPAEVFRTLLEQSSAIAREVDRKIAERKQTMQKQVRVPIWDDTTQGLLSDQFDRLGLMQGQRLMVIDLNRCTRCDECVRACVNTHADGHSRLFLDGPRFGKYLVPNTCRSCLDPVCMIGCPVGSIHRGDNGQMEIEDWCIGCGLCAQQCPYDSIHMYDVGVISEEAWGWRYLPQSALGSAPWQSLGYKESNWLQAGRAPFVNDRVFRESVAPFRKDSPGNEGNVLRKVSARTMWEISLGSAALVSNLGEATCFRYEFTLAADMVGPNQQFKLEAASPDPALLVWVNGRELPPADKPKGGRREYLLPPKETPGKTAPAAPAQLLQAGRNVVAVQVNPAAVKSGETFLKVRMDEVRKPEGVSDDVTFKVVTERAVVCDLCSSQSGQKAACVNACPHDAALRIDARFDFPTS